MSAPALAIFLALSPAALSSQETTPRGWVRQGRSLLLYDSSGDLASELGLGVWEDQETRGGVSPGGRFAWLFQTKSTRNSGRGKKVIVERNFKLLGSTGSELWSSEEIDFPRSGNPVGFSALGETLLVALHGKTGWSVAAKNYLGNTLFEAGPFADLESIDLTPNGRYAVARWREAEKSATHTFLDIPSRVRKDIPSEEFLLGHGHINDEGRVLLGAKTLFDFTAPTSTSTAAAAPPLPEKSP